MPDDDVDPMLAKHPELRGVRLALEQLRDGEPVTAPCSICGHTLIAVEIAVIGTVDIRCRDGCTRFRARTAKR